VAWSAASVAAQVNWGMALAVVGCAVLLSRFIKSQRRCLDAVAQLIRNAAESAGLVDRDIKPMPEQSAANSISHNAEHSSKAISNDHVAPVVEESHWQPVGQN